MSNFEKHFYEAMLVWSAEILKTLRHLEKKARLNLDGILELLLERDRPGKSRRLR
jgi:hypothetical protein